MHSLFLFVLLLAVCLTQMAADIYAPSLPAIAADFKTSIENVQWSLSIYMLGVAGSQLIYGPLSEGLGRKPPIVTGLVIMMIGSIICMTSSTIEVLITGRLIQGLGAGACTCLWRSIFRDMFSGEDLARSSSYLSIFIMFIVPSAPLLGGYLQVFFGWQANFIFMTGYTLIALMGMLFIFKETNQTYNVSRLKMDYVIKNYIFLLKNPLFMGVALSTFLSYGAFFSWFVIGPALLIEKLKLDPSTFGWFSFCGGGAAYALAGFANGKLVKSFGIPFMMRFGWSVMILSGIFMGVGYFIYGLNMWAITIPVTLFYFGSTFIWPNAFATAFSPFGHMAGYAAALYGFMQVCGAATLAGIISYLPQDNQMIFAFVMTMSSTAAWFIYELVNDTSVSD